MSIEIVRSTLLWCTLINFGFLALWTLIMAFPHEWLYRLWGRWFRLSAEQFDLASFHGILIYKMLILVFNAVPYIALVIIGAGAGP